MSYLSFVFTGSNAGYGGDFIQRMQNCLDNLYSLLEKYEFDADVTVVEWNPPKDRPRIADVIDWNSKWIQTKIITVPGEVHKNLPNPHGEKYFEYFAKNVGIRRAAGKFILSTNPDNIYSTELIQRLSKLDKDCFYRVNRYDVRDENVFQVNKNTGTYFTDGGSTEGELTHGDPIGLHFNASGDFILAHRNAWEEINGHPEVPYSLTVDGQTVYLLDKHGYKQVILTEPMYHADHSRTPKFSPAWSDKAPYAEKKNGNDWGLRNFGFNETAI